MNIKWLPFYYNPRTTSESLFSRGQETTSDWIIHHRTQTLRNHTVPNFVKYSTSRSPPVRPISRIPTEWKISTSTTYRKHLIFLCLLFFQRPLYRDGEIFTFLNEQNNSLRMTIVKWSVSLLCTLMHVQEKRSTGPRVKHLNPLNSTSRLFSVP